MTFSYRTGGTVGQPLTGTPEPHGRLMQMTDGTGTTSYGYNAVGRPAWARPAWRASTGRSRTTRSPTATTSWGAPISRSVNGAANSQTTSYDELGRVTSISNLLGAFGYGYDGVTGRVLSQSYPNGQTTTFAYETNAGDHRLEGDLAQALGRGHALEVQLHDRRHRQHQDLATATRCQPGEALRPRLRPRGPARERGAEDDRPDAGGAEALRLRLRQGGEQDDRADRRRRDRRDATTA